MNKQIWSFSHINTYLQCPLAWKYHYLLKIPQPASEILESGKQAHEVIQSYVNYLVRTRKKYDPAYKPKQVLKPEVEKMFKQFQENFLLNLDTFLATEKEIAITKEKKLTDWWDNNCWFRGKIDRIEKQDSYITITDYKTSQAISINKLQLGVYAWLAHFAYPDIDTFILQDHFLRFGIVKTIEMGLKDIKDTEEKVRAYIKTIEAELEKEEINKTREEKYRTRTFKPRPGTNCEYCPYVFKCETALALQEQANIPLITSKEQATDIARKLIIVEARLKGVKKLLKAWVDKNENIELDMGTYGFQPSSSAYITDVGAFIEALYNAEKDPMEYLNVDMRKAKKIIKELGLQGLLGERKSVKFGFKKRKPELKGSE